MSTEIFKRYAELEKQRRELKVQLDSVKEQIAEIEEDVLNAMAELGTDQLRVDGFTIYQDHRIWASPARGEGENLEDAHRRAMEILEKFGWDDVGGIRINTNKLSAKVRRYINKHGELPEELQSVIKITEQYRPKARKA